MEILDSKLTVYFEDPFWVGVFERSFEGKFQVCRVVFGAEPKDSEIHHLILTQWNSLQFSEPVNGERPLEKHIDPKRLQRVISKQIQSIGIGTKSQQAIKLQMEMYKVEGKSKKHQEEKLVEERLYHLKEQKRKEKHKGH